MHFYMEVRVSALEFAAHHSDEPIMSLTSQVSSAVWLFLWIPVKSVSASMKCQGAILVKRGRQKAKKGDGNFTKQLACVLILKSSHRNTFQSV